MRFDGADWIRFQNVNDTFAPVTVDDWTYAVLIKRATTGSFQALGYALAGGVALQGLTFHSTNNLVEDNGSSGQSSSAFASTASPYLFVLSKVAGAVPPTLSWKLGSGGSWTDETWTQNQPDKSAADSLEFGTWQGGSDLLNAWVGLVGWWEGAMSTTNKHLLATNWRTSDWWNSPHSQPLALIEFDKDPDLIFDLVGNATNVLVTGTPTLDAAESLDSWNFDGTGTPPPDEPEVITADITKPSLRFSYR